MELTPAKLRYLLTFTNIEQLHNGKGVRCIDVAIRLGVARPSVCRMLSYFESEGLIIQDDSRLFHTTELGRTIISRFQKQYKTLYPFFRQALNLSDFDSEECAMALLSSLSAPILKHLCSGLSALTLNQPA